VIVGEEAHIRSSKATGPRHDPDYPIDKLNEYENLVLLCPTHHTIIDKDGGSAWPIDVVLRMKIDHEARVDAALSGPGDDPEKAAFVARIARWETLIGLANWQELTRTLNYVHPYLTTVRSQALAETAIWLAGVSWPPRFPKLAAAFETHRRVVDVLVAHISGSFVGGGQELKLRRRHKEMLLSVSRGHGSAFEEAE